MQAQRPTTRSFFLSFLFVCFLLDLNSQQDPSSLLYNIYIYYSLLQQKQKLVRYLLYIMEGSFLLMVLLERQ